MRRLEHGFARLAATSAALVAAVVPHLAHFPPWISAGLGVAIAWRLLAERRGWAMPPGWLRLAGAGLATLAVLGRYHTLNGLDPGTALLGAMAALKLTETRAPRDHAVLVFIGYFLCLATLLYGESITHFLAAGAAAWLLTAALARSHRPAEANSPVRPLMLAARTLLLGLPLAACLFLFVPRIEGRFWAIPESADTSRSGLAERMSPGDIAQLSLSDEPAFRVWFEGPAPAADQQYFRVLVLEDFDGRAFARATEGRSRGERAPGRQGADVRYRLVLEPGVGRWTPALETVVDWPRDRLTRSPAGELRDRDAAEGATRGARLDVTMTSDLQARLGGDVLAPELAARNLALPDGAAPRTRAKARLLRAAEGDDRRYIQAVLAAFHDAPFEYTLSPPRLGADPIDEFLEVTRSGFCEHYAAAFTVLMRAAGIPARVVIGYQGGEFNRFGGYLLVRAASAHAWSEVWIAGRGWTRVDPTAAVAPERIRGGALPDSRRAATDGPRFMGELGWLGAARSAWDALRTAWTDNVVRFDSRRQERLLAALGLEGAGTRGLALALAGSFAIAAALLAAWLAWELRPRRTDAVLAAWDAVCARLARGGTARAPHEGPLDFAARVGRERPALAAAFGGFAADYIALRYLADADGDTRRRYLLAARALRRAPLRPTG